MELAGIALCEFPSSFDSVGFIIHNHERTVLLEHTVRDSLDGDTVLRAVRRRQTGRKPLSRPLYGEGQLAHTAGGVPDPFIEGAGKKAADFGEIQTRPLLLG